MATEVGRHTFAVLKQLHRFVGQPHVELLVDELIRGAVEVLLHGHVIVNVDLGLGPVGHPSDLVGHHSNGVPKLSDISPEHCPI